MHPLQLLNDNHMHVVNSYRFGSAGIGDQGLYSEAQLDVMIFSNGYIPIASHQELDKIRMSQTTQMGVGTKYESNYTVSGFGRTYVLLKNISLASYNWIGISNHSGPCIFDGNGLIIDQLTVNNSLSLHLGLFNAFGGVFKNVNLINAIITNTNASAGVSGLIYNGNTITQLDNCHVSGTFISNASISGLINISSSTTNINNCSFVGIVSTTGNYASGISGGNATFTNCTVNADITANNYAAGICSYGESGSFTNCNVNGDITSNNYTAGICSYYNSITSFTDCEYSGTINTSGNAGGVISFTSFNTTITNCYTNLSIIAAINSIEANVGGIAGFFRATTSQCINCHTNVNISGGAYYGGGLIGTIGAAATNKISKCYSTGSITTKYIAGGLLGSCFGGGTVENSYSTCTVHTSQPSGSFIGSGGLIGGSLNGTLFVTNSYSVGAVTSASTALGGLIGNAPAAATVTASYWDTVTSGQATSAGGTGKTTTEMQTGAIPYTTIYVGWSATIWNAGTTSEYPYLN